MLYRGVILRDLFVLLVPGLLVEVQRMRMEDQVPRQFVGITADGGMKLVNVELPVPFRETSQRRGFLKLYSRRFSFI